MAVQALLWEKDPARVMGVRCMACSHYCRIGSGEAGQCRVRVNRDGVLYSLSSCHIAAANLDPVEKKPLFHFMPGTQTFSLGTPGCNMTCAFCQNHGLSQGKVPDFGSTETAMPAKFIARIIASAEESCSASISYTYNEPTVSPELIAAVAPRTIEAGLANILVSNAYAGKESMAVLKPLIHAANFDLKSFNDAFYRDLCGARLTPVLRTITSAAHFGWWVEITTLLIPGHNDSDTELASIARFIKEELGPHVPWHVSRFRPMFKLKNAPPTPLSSLERAHAIGKAEGLHFVYTGNVPGHDAESTYCPNCGGIFVRRVAYTTSPPASNVCIYCNFPVSGVWHKK